MKASPASLAICCAALLPAPAQATWSIVAVDPVTREVGSAGASCTPFVAGIVRLVPGRGAIVAQAMSNMEAKARGGTLIAQGRSPQAIIAAITDSAFDNSAQSQQYGIAVITGDGGSDAAAFTGSETSAYAGQRTAKDVAIQGNILVSAAVLDAAMTAFRKSSRAPLAERLLAALEAGSRVGGDKRCGIKTAQSAYLGVARPDDRADRPSVRIVLTTDREDGRNPVAEVRRKFDRPGTSLRQP